MFAKFQRSKVAFIYFCATHNFSLSSCEIRIRPRLRHVFLYVASIRAVVLCNSSDIPPRMLQMSIEMMEKQDSFREAFTSMEEDMHNDPVSIGGFALCCTASNS